MGTDLLSTLVRHTYDLQNLLDGLDALFGATGYLDGDFPSAQLLDLVALDGGGRCGGRVVGANDIAVLEQRALDADVLGLDRDERCDAVARQQLLDARGHVGGADGTKDGDGLRRRVGGRLVRDACVASHQRGAVHIFLRRRAVLFALDARGDDGALEGQGLGEQVVQEGGGFLGLICRSGLWLAFVVLLRIGVMRASPMFMSTPERK